MNLYSAPNDVPEQSIFIANLKAPGENEWGSVKDFLIWAFDSQHTCVKGQEYKYIDFSMTRAWTGSRGWLLSSNIFTSAGARQTLGVAGTVLVEPR